MDITVTPSYGRDYKSKAAAEADWREGKDFTVASVGRWTGSQCSVRDMSPGDRVTIRYARLTRATVVTVGGGSDG